MDNNIALNIYENSLLGKERFVLKKERSDREDKNKAYDTRPENAAFIIRYVITELLGWTAHDAVLYMTPLLAEKFNLPAVIAYLDIGKNISYKKNMPEIIRYCFKEDTKSWSDKNILDVYKMVMNKEISRFPTGIFSGPDGGRKLSVLLLHYIASNIPSSDISYLYEYFGNKQLANKILRKAHLYYAYRELYSTPLEFFHNSLGEDERNEMLYHFYKYMDKYQTIESQKEKLLPA